MKRYALLTGATYYPSPGWTALTSWHDSIEEGSAEGERVAGESYDWWQLVDMQTGKIVAGQGSGHSGLFGMVSANPQPKD